MWGCWGYLQRSAADTGRKCRPRDRTRNLLVVRRLKDWLALYTFIIAFFFLSSLFRDFFWGWRPGLKLLFYFNMLTNLKFRYFIYLFILFCQQFFFLSCLGYLAQLNATATSRHTLPETDGLLSWDPCVVWPVLAAVWLIHGVVARSSPLQSGTHKQMYMTFWFDSLDPGGSFSSPGSLDSEWVGWKTDIVSTREEEDFVLQSAPESKQRILTSYFSSGSRLMSKQLLLETLKMLNQTHD